MGVSTFTYPCSQAFALPRIKDKQRSQPTPRILYTIESPCIKHSRILEI